MLVAQYALVLAWTSRPGTELLGRLPCATRALRAALPHGLKRVGMIVNQQAGGLQAPPTEAAKATSNNSHLVQCGCQCWQQQRINKRMIAESFSNRGQRAAEEISFQCIKGTYK